MTPFRVAFVDQTTTNWFIAELFLDSLFIVDLMINFISAKEINDEEFDCRFRVIAISYLKSWFALDVIGEFNTLLFIFFEH